MKDKYRVLLLGASNATFSESGPQNSMYRLIEEELARQVPHVQWQCTAELLFFGPTMQRRALAMVERTKADVALLIFASPGFSMEAVVYRLEHIHPTLFRPALRAAHLLKAAAGGGTEGSPSPRGLVFRGPRFVASKLLGSIPRVPLEHAIAFTKETVDSLLRLEDVAVICRLTVPTAYYAAQVAEDKRRVGVFNSAIIEHCRAKRVAWYDPAAELRSSGLEFTFGPDNLHASFETRTVEARTAAGVVLAELDH